MPKGYKNDSLKDVRRYYVPEPATRCWLWQGALDMDGYGRFWLGGKEYQAHRAMYELMHGPIHRGLVIDHVCRVKHCVNPDHLEAVTIKENTRRGLLWNGNQCKRGHPMDEKNTRINTDGRRTCRACAALWARKERRRLAGLPEDHPTPTPNSEKTHCKRGHEFSAENTRVGPEGKRHCRTCERDWFRTKRASLQILKGGQ